MKSKPRRTFSREFKIEAVRAIRDEHKSVSQVARELEVTRQLLRTWCKQVEGRDGAPIDEVFPGKGNLAGPEDEIRRLRRENAQLREEREILKKAAAFFAKESR